MLEPLAQLDKLRLVGQEVPVVVDYLVGEDRFVAGRRRNVAPYRPGAGGGLLLRLQQPPHEQPRRVWMRRLLEDRAGERPDRRRIYGGEMRSHRLALPFHRFGDVEDRIDRDGVFAGSDAALLAEMTLDEVWLVEYVLVHPVPAVFLHHVMEQPERGVVVRRIGRHRLTAELRLEKIKRGVRHVG